MRGRSVCDVFGCRQSSFVVSILYEPACTTLAATLVLNSSMLLRSFSPASDGAESRVHFESSDVAVVVTPGGDDPGPPYDPVYAYTVAAVIQGAMLALGSAWLPIVSLAAPEGRHSFRVSIALSLIGEICMLVAFALAPASVVVAVFSHSLVFTATLVRQHFIGELSVLNVGPAVVTAIVSVALLVVGTPLHLDQPVTHVIVEEYLSPIRSALL
jgi:hypothetical protein